MTINNFVSLTHIERFLVRFPNAVLTLLIGFLFLRLLQWGLEVALRAARVTKPMQDILVSMSSAVLWIALFALVFQSIGLNQIAIALTSSVAVIGLGIATGANKLVSDVVAGVFLARNRDFKIGQHIKIDQVEGEIYSLDSRKVRITGKDGQLYVIPNTKFDEQVWEVKETKT